MFPLVLLGFLSILKCFNSMKTKKKYSERLKAHLINSLNLLVLASMFINVCVPLYVDSVAPSLWLGSVSRGPNVRLLSLCNQALHSWAKQCSSSHPNHHPCSPPCDHTSFIWHTSYSFLYSFPSVVCVFLDTFRLLCAVKATVFITAVCTSSVTECLKEYKSWHGVIQAFP